MLNKEEIIGAVARGYCTDANRDKVLDPELVEAIVEEIQKAILEKIQPDFIINS